MTPKVQNTGSPRGFELKKPLRTMGTLNGSTGRSSFENLTNGCHQRLNVNVLACQLILICILNALATFPVSADATEF